jgi:hypothetical protein
LGKEFSVIMDGLAAKIGEIIHLFLREMAKLELSDFCSLDIGPGDLANGCFHNLYPRLLIIAVQRCVGLRKACCFITPKRFSLAKENTMLRLIPGTWF